MSCTITALQRYPVKGLSPEGLERVMLTPYQGLPGDRAVAFALAEAPFDAAAPRHLAKTNFLMLQRDEALARLSTRYDAATGVLTIVEDGVALIDGDIGEAMGRARLENFFQEFLDIDARPRLVSVAGHMFSDRAEKVVSLQNLASIAEFGQRFNAEVDPIRFRGNVHLDGLAPWVEFTWPGRKLRLGETVLEVIDPIRRCAATTVNPETALRDLNIPKLLMQGYGHMNMGIYARVLEGGTIAIDDTLEVLTV